MLKVKPIGPDVASYYLRQGPGRWAGGGCAHLGLAGEVEPAELRAVLRGRHPREKRFLPELRAARRRAGWDLIFAAPKSLSLVAASQSGLAPAISGAHRGAVGEALRHFEDCLMSVRRAGEASGRAPASGAVAAAFDHVSNAGGEPHVHTHLLLMNLAKDSADRWWSVGPWWLERTQLDAIYRLGLRHHLEVRGLEFDWRVRPDALVDIATVPRAAVQAASSRAHEAAAGARFTGRSEIRERPWRERARSVGWDPARVAVSPTSTRPRDLEATITNRLAMSGSTFGRRDVLMALSERPEASFASDEARAWTDNFLARCIPVDGRSPMWTSELARSADKRLEAELHSSHRTIVVLGSAPRTSGFLGHAALLDSCARAWNAAGLDAAVATRTALDALRWSTLTGLGEFRASRRPDILIVDQADRRTSADLQVLLRSAPAATVLLVEGGTAVRPAKPSSRALEGLPRLDPSQAPVWEVGADRQDPAHLLLERWAQTRGGGADQPVVLVGLGLPETLALNDAARRYLASCQQINGPEVVVRGRSFRSGDTVLAVRPLGRRLPAGTFGTVAAVDPAERAVTIDWGDRIITSGGAALTRVGHGYAATPRLAARTPARALVLGPAEGIGLDRGRVIGAALERDATLDHGPETWSVHR
jgi:conjugative relaxase-like TrwC/TraI family protein